MPGVPSLQGASGCPVLHQEAGVSAGGSSAGHGPPQCSHYNDNEQQDPGKYDLHSDHGLYVLGVRELTSTKVKLMTY